MKSLFELVRADVIDDVVSNCGMCVFILCKNTEDCFYCFSRLHNERISYYGDKDCYLRPRVAIFNAAEVEPKRTDFQLLKLLSGSFCSHSDSNPPLMRQSELDSIITETLNEYSSNFSLYPNYDAR
jgi:hypothetical protein